MSHLVPAPYPVVRNEAAEARTNDYAAMLRAHDRGVARAHVLKSQAPTDEALSMNATFNEKMLAEAHDMNATFDKDAENSMLEEAYQTNADIDHYKAVDEAHDNALVEKKYRESRRGKAAAAIRKTPAKVRGATSKVRNATSKDRLAAVLTTQRSRAREYFNDDERGNDRKAVAGLLGVVAAAGLFYLATKGVDVSGYGDEAASSGANDMGNSMNLASDASTSANEVPTETVGTAEPSQAAPATAEITAENPTLSHLAQDNLKAQGHTNVTGAEIDAEWRRIAALNQLSLDDLNNMHVGDKVKLN